MLPENARRLITRLVLLAITAVAAAILSLPAAAQTPAAPVAKLTVKPFGPVLTTRGHKALYYWTVEGRDFKVHCTGACAKAWPPLLVAAAAAVPKRVAGVKGAFGTIRRPGGRLQVTWNRRPVYTYAHEGPNQVLCDDVDGWFVVRV